MADQGQEQAGHKPDVFLLICGVLTLLVSAYVLGDGQTWLPSIDPRWLLVGGAATVGALLLVSSVARRR